MEALLVKIFATALALSEVMTQPQAVKTKFDPVADQATVVQILRDGCAHMRHAFDIESINLDELITTALNDPKAAGANAQAFHGDRKSTRLNSSHLKLSRMPSSA